MELYRQDCERYGFPGKVPSWFKSYLTNRVQLVIINDAYFLWGTTRISPWSVTVLPFLRAVRGDHCCPWAELHDICWWYTTLCISNSRSHENVLSSIQLCTKDMMAWCSSNGLSYNADKPEAVYISSCYSISEKIDKIQIGDAILTPILTVRDLGTIVDHHLNLRQTC